MGKKNSKEAGEEEKESKLYDRKKIYMDEFGNFVYGEEQFDPEEEMMRIMACDDNKHEDGKEWCIINTAWMNAWMLYCHLNKDVNPNPGPCRNECLLELDEYGEAWVPKPGLVMARKDKEGDYRRISKAAWDVFCELYPGSGPEIKITFFEDEEHKVNGAYDTSTWIIDQSALVKVEKKIKFPGFGRSKNKKEVETKDIGVEIPADEGIPMVQMEDGAITEEKRENISEFFGRKADSSRSASAASSSAEPKYSPAPTRGSSSKSDKEDVNKWLFEE